MVAVSKTLGFSVFIPRKGTEAKVSIGLSLRPRFSESLDIHIPRKGTETGKVVDAKRGFL